MIKDNLIPAIKENWKLILVGAWMIWLALMQHDIKNTLDGIEWQISNLDSKVDILDDSDQLDDIQKILKEIQRKLPI